MARRKNDGITASIQQNSSDELLSTNITVDELISGESVEYINNTTSVNTTNQKLSPISSMPGFAEYSGGDVMDIKVLTDSEIKNTSAVKPLMSNSSFSIEVNGLILRNNSVYTLTGKEDDSAPAAFREYGVSKLPVPGIGEYKTCRFDDRSHVYDTGLYIGSMCYRGMDLDKQHIQQIVDERIKYIAEPYTRITGHNLEQDNFEFWDNYSPYLTDSRSFYTSDEIQLFELYVIIQSHLAVPKDLEGSPDFPFAMYCIEDQSKVIDITEKRAVYKAKAYSLFSEFMREDRRKVDYALNWNRMYSTDNLNDGMLTVTFSSFLDNKDTTSNAEDFVSTCEAMKTSPTQYETARLFFKLMKLNYMGKLNKSAIGYALEGYDLGTELKNTAYAMAINDPKYAEVRIRVLNLTENM